MMRRPNPWVAVPVVVATLIGGVVGFQITRVSCAPDTCTGAALGVGIIAALVACLGVGTVVVLAVRSIAEWREIQARGAAPPPDEEPGPPTC